MCAEYVELGIGTDVTDAQLTAAVRHRITVTFNDNINKDDFTKYEGNFNIIIYHFL